MRKLLISIFVVLPTLIFCQSDSLSLIFIGDIMGHQPQIESAYDLKSKSYNYDHNFSKISKIINSVDFAIANLEVTLAASPYSGYPAFSSPDALALACKNNGIDVLVTSNNHSCDRGRKGVQRSLSVLDSLGLKHTGTFRDSLDWKQNNLLVLSKNNIRIGLLNYTYGTNGINTPKPTVVNRIDTVNIRHDIEQSKQKNLDKLIVFLHWGNEYQTSPSSEQTKLAKFIFDLGVDIIIGSHPHVLQKMEYFPGDNKNKERFIAYSLGNFISNQRTSPRDGGAIVKIVLTKDSTGVKIKDKGYYLTWVDKPVIDGKTVFEVIPCAELENDNFFEMSDFSISKMKIFTTKARELFQNNNRNVRELR